MAEAGAGPYSHVHMFMQLKHIKSGRSGVVIGWGDHNGVPYLHLYFADREPADKSASRSKCYEWRRLSRFVPMNVPPFINVENENVVKPHHPEDDEHDAKKMPEDDEHDAKKIAKSERNREVDKLKDDDKSLADDDFIMLDEAPQKPK